MCIWSFPISYRVSQVNVWFTQISYKMLQTSFLSCSIMFMVFKRKVSFEGTRIGGTARNIYLWRYEYLFTTMLPWTTPSPYKKELFTLSGPMKSLIFQFGQMTLISPLWSSSIQIHCLIVRVHNSGLLLFVLKRADIFVEANKYLLAICS